MIQYFTSFFSFPNSKGFEYYTHFTSDVALRAYLQVEVSGMKVLPIGWSRMRRSKVKEHRTTRRMTIIGLLVYPNIISFKNSSCIALMQDWLYDFSLKLHKPIGVLDERYDDWIWSNPKVNIYKQLVGHKSRYVHHFHFCELRICEMCAVLFRLDLLDIYWPSLVLIWFQILLEVVVVVALLESCSPWNWSTAYFPSELLRLTLNCYVQMPINSIWNEKKGNNKYPHSQI